MPRSDGRGTSGAGSPAGSRPVDAAGGDADRDPALLILEPEPLVLEVDLEATLGVAVRVADVRADERLLPGDLTFARHGNLFGSAETRSSTL
jgi:hypothetical protein